MEHIARTIAASAVGSVWAFVVVALVLGILGRVANAIYKMVTRRPARAAAPAANQPRRINAPETAGWLPGQPVHQLQPAAARPQLTLDQDFEIVAVTSLPDTFLRLPKTPRLLIPPGIFRKE